MKVYASTVLAHVQPGHSVAPPLTPEQRAALADDEGRRALSYLGHYVHALRQTERETGRKLDIVLAPSFVQRMGFRMGEHVGRNEARRLVRRLLPLLDFVGVYRRAYDSRSVYAGFRVDRWSLRVVTASPGRTKACIATRRKPSLRKWWMHPLFGNPDGLPPPGVGKRKRHQWVSNRHEVWERERART